MLKEKESISVTISIIDTAYPDYPLDGPVEFEAESFSSTSDETCSLRLVSRSRLSYAYQNSHTTQGYSRAIRMKIDEYLRIPYRKNGRGWDGADCYDFARLIIERETGFRMPILDGRTAAISDDFNLYEEIPEPEELSLVYLRGGPFREAHVAVYTEGMLLHMTENGPCCQDWKRFRRYAKAIYIPKALQ